MEEEEDVVSAWEVWDVVQRQARDGHMYTTLRHARMGMAVELWHESMGGFYLYTPSSEEDGGFAASVYCCFSNGIAVLEDSLCGPELLLELCRHGSRWQDGAWVRDEEYEISEGGISVTNSSRERTWIIQRNGAANILRGDAARNCVVVSHVSAPTQIVLTHKGVVFVGSDAMLIPHPPDGRLRNARRGASDPVMLSLHETVKGVKWEYEWERGKESSKRWDWFGGGKGWLEPPIGDSWIPRVLNRSSVISTFEQGNQEHQEIWVGRERGPDEDSRGVGDFRWSKDPSSSNSSSDSDHLGPRRWAGSFARWGGNADGEGVGEGGYVSVVRDDGPLELVIPGRAPLRQFLQDTHALRYQGGRNRCSTASLRKATGEGQRKDAGGNGKEEDEEEAEGEMYREWCLAKAQSSSVDAETLQRVLASAAQNGWHEVWARVEEEIDGRVEERVVWRWPWNDSKLDLEGRGALGVTALMQSCFRLDLRFTLCLLRRGADVNGTDLHEQTSLYYAINHVEEDPDGFNHQRQTEVIALLLSFGANPNVVDHTNVSPLMSAACAGQLEAVRLLLRHGARPFGRDRAGFSLMDLVRCQRSWTATADARARLDAMIEVLGQAAAHFDFDATAIAPPPPRPSAGSDRKLRTLTGQDLTRHAAAGSDSEASSDRGVQSRSARDPSRFDVMPGDEEVGTALCSFGGVGVCWLNRAAVEEELRMVGAYDEGSSRPSTGRDEESEPRADQSIKVTRLAPGMRVRILAPHLVDADAIPDEEAADVEGVLTKVKGNRVVVNVGAHLRAADSALRFEQEHDKHRVTKVLLRGRWVSVRLEVPEGCILLSSPQGLELLSRADDAATSMYADLLPLWRKQQTPTSCGACCALLVHNFLAPASSTSASASASASGPLAVSAPLALYTADMAATVLRWTEKDVMEHCPTLVPGVDPKVLWRRGLTLNQVSVLCRSLLHDGWDARAFFSSDGATIDQFRLCLKTCLGPGLKKCVIANFYMGARQNGGIGSEFEMGHHSPVGAYDEVSDMALVMDVWSQSADAYWVHLPVLWEGMRRGVKEVWGDGNVSEKSRGWVLVGPAIQGRKTHTQNKDKS